MLFYEKESLKMLYTWEEINDPKIVNYREREKAIHLRRYHDLEWYRKSCKHWDKIREKIVPRIRTEEEKIKDLEEEIVFKDKELKALRHRLQIMKEVLKDKSSTSL
jgi:hypothetical protein